MTAADPAAAPGAGAGGLAVVDACGRLDDLLNPGPAQRFEPGKGLLVAGQVTQAPGERDGVLDGQGGALPGGRGGCVRGVADDDHAPGVPGGQARHVCKAAKSLARSASKRRGSRSGTGARRGGVQLACLDDVQPLGG